MNRSVVIGGIAVALLGVGTAAQAQTPEFPWSVEFGLGWDNSISGNINSSAFGRLEGLPVVITKNKYEDVYGTGLNMRFGGGYMLSEAAEVRVTFTFQSLDADLTPMGDIGVSPLYGQYSDYQVFSMDVGMRRYLTVSPDAKWYAEGAVGLGFVDKTDIELLAPAIDLYRDGNDFYDQTVAFTLGGNLGLRLRLTERAGVFVQGGLRWVSGMAEVDDLEGTGLETINDKSARWTFPFLTGVEFRF